MRRDLYGPDHEAFRESVRAFVATEVTPHHDAWERAGLVDREVWRAAGRAGLLGTAVPEEYGGGGVDDFRFNAVLDEELAAAGASGPAFPLHNDIVLPYLLAYATEEQKKRWLPGVCSGETVLAIAMTEPDAGSDLQGIRTTAVRDGDTYLLNGTKTFVSSGVHADVVVVVARTEPDAGYEGISLLVVERGTPGFDRGRPLEKIGLTAQDTAELSFTDCRVPAENLLGREGGGFVALMENLPQERLCIAVGAVAASESVLEATVSYAKERQAFGRPIGSFQHTRFTLAELATEVQVARVFVDRCVAEHVEGRLTVADAAMAKWWTTELQQKVVDRCLQVHGGYGYMRENPVARAYLDSRVQTVYGGTTEIMKEIVGRSMGL